MKHLEGTFSGRRDFKLYYQGWLPETEVKAVLLIAHGIAEHTGRYLNTASYLASRGLAVYGFDYRGHGRSEGKRCHIEKFCYFIDDFKTFYSLIRGMHPGKKIFVLGHSMGAAIGLEYVLAYPKEPAGIIISAVPLRIQPYFPYVLVALLQPLATLTPGLGIYRLNSETLSRDRTIVEGYDNDPLVYRGKLPARITLGLIRMLHCLENRISQIKVPILILHGTKDNLSSPEGSNIVYTNTGSRDKSLKVYDGFYHEILNEPQRNQVWSDIETWLNLRCQ
jgi:acylglycerol lipase